MTTATFISLDHPVLAVFWWWPSLRCLPTGHLLSEGPSRKFPVPFMSLFLIIFEIISKLISLIFRVVMIKCYNQECFYRDTISRKVISQEWRAPLAHETRLFLAGCQPIIYMPLVFIVIILLLLLLLLNSKHHTTSSNYRWLSISDTFQQYFT